MVGKGGKGREREKERKRERERKRGREGRNRLGESIFFFYQRLLGSDPRQDAGFAPNEYMRPYP